MRLERRENVGEGEDSFAIAVVTPEQSTLVGFDAGPFVYDVIGEIEIFRNIYAEVFRKVFVGVEVDARAECIEQMVRHGCSSLLCDDGDEAGLRVAAATLTMKLFRIEIDAVAGFEDEFFILNSHDDGAFEDEVELLTMMGDQFCRFVARSKKTSSGCMIFPV